MKGKMEFKSISDVKINVNSLEINSSQNLPKAKKIYLH